MDDLFDDIDPTIQAKGLLSNGFPSARPFEDYQMDKMPYAERFWATIAMHKQAAYQQGIDDAKASATLAADELKEKSEADEIDSVIAIIRAVNFTVTDEGACDGGGLECHLNNYDRLTKYERDKYRDLLDALEERVRADVWEYKMRKELDE